MNVTDVVLQMVEAVAAILTEGTNTGFTVMAIVFVFVQPKLEVKVYVMVVLPAATAVTKPVLASTVAMAVFKDDQTPPATE